MGTAAPIDGRSGQTAGYSPGYLRYALGLLTLVYVVNFVDRQILSILLESIKQDLGLSDVQLGLLSGTAFGIFYATLGVPIARLADRFSRKGVIAICLAIWSGMTALCGTASGFALLLTYRVGVGIGEERPWVMQELNLKFQITIYWWRVFRASRFHLLAYRKNNH